MSGSYDFNSFGINIFGAYTMNNFISYLLDLMLNKPFLQILIPEVDYWLFERHSCCFGIKIQQGIWYASGTYYHLRSAFVCDPDVYEREAKANEEFKRRLRRTDERVKAAKERKFFFKAATIISAIAIFSLALYSGSDFYVTITESLNYIFNPQNPEYDSYYELLNDDMSEIDLSDDDDILMDQTLYDSDDPEPII